MFNKQYYTYIMSNKTDSVIYIGVTNDLIRRVYEHKNHLIKGFTSNYNVEKLIYFEDYNDIELAITREKQLKSWKREKKLQLIYKHNPLLNDLYNDII